MAGTHISLGDGAHIPVTMAVPLEAAALQAQLQQLQPGGRLLQAQLQPGNHLLQPGGRDATKAVSPDTSKAARAAYGHGAEEGRAVEWDHSGEVKGVDH